MRPLVLVVLGAGLVALTASTAATDQESSTEAPRADRSVTFVEFGLEDHGSELSARVGSWPTDEHPWLEPCVVEKARVRCQVPVGRPNLRVAVDGFSPMYLKNVETVAQVTRGLGTLNALDGAAIAGTLTPTRASVSLRPTEPGPAPEGNRISLPSGWGLLQHQNGFFHAGGLQPGDYELTVRSPGYEPKRLEVSLREGEELMLEPVRLESVP